MGTYIAINKVYEQNDIYYYFVESPEPKISKFYIGIDSINNKVLLFASNNFTQIKGIIDFNVSDIIPEIYGFDQAIVLKVAVQAYTALKKNSFPDNIGRYS